MPCMPASGLGSYLGRGSEQTPTSPTSGGPAFYEGRQQAPGRLQLWLRRNLGKTLWRDCGSLPARKQIVPMGTKLGTRPFGVALQANM